MAAVAFDTRETFTKLVRSKAFTEKQAETLVDILKETHDDVVTNKDLTAALQLLEERLSHRILKSQLALFFALAGLFLAVAKYFVHS